MEKIKKKKKKSLALWQIQPQHQNKGNLDLVWVTLYQKSTPLATICMYLIPDRWKFSLLSCSAIFTTLQALLPKEAIWAIENMRYIPSYVSTRTFKKRITWGAPEVSHFHRATNSFFKWRDKICLPPPQYSSQMHKVHTFKPKPCLCSVLCWLFASASPHLPLHCSSYFMPPCYPSLW